MVNGQVEIMLGGKKIKIKRMSLKTIFAPIQSKIKDEYYADVNRMAKDMNGKDLLDFRTSALKQCPSKGELDRLAMDYMLSPSGVIDTLYRGINKFKTDEFGNETLVEEIMTEQELSDIVLNCKDESEIAYIQSYLTGEDFESIKKKLMEEKLQAEKEAKKSKKNA